MPESVGGAIRVLAVRDEDPARLWDPLGEWWPSLPGVVGVRDRLAGGAWLAASPEAGRLALVLNRAEVEASAGVGAESGRSLRSRGSLVLEAAEGMELGDRPETAGFNLISVADGRVEVTQWDGASLERRELSPGVHMIAHHDVDDIARTPRIARWLPEFRALAGLPEDSWRERWIALLERSSRLDSGDDQAIIRDNRAHGYPTQSLLVCLAEVRADPSESHSALQIDSATLAEPAHWQAPTFDRFSVWESDPSAQLLPLAENDAQ